jgi:hypothetical protein
MSATPVGPQLTGRDGFLNRINRLAGVAAALRHRRAVPIRPNCPERQGAGHVAWRKSRRYGVDLCRQYVVLFKKSLHVDRSSAFPVKRFSDGENSRIMPPPFLAAGWRECTSRSEMARTEANFLRAPLPRMVYCRCPEEGQKPALPDPRGNPRNHDRVLALRGRRLLSPAEEEASRFVGMTDEHTTDTTRKEQGQNSQTQNRRLGRPCKKKDGER